ncbi:MAG: serine/threonine protein kinase [Planctomycetes bacterium]|nr:serine/threonine protein kinase [Planctomycetota bacterium]
MEPIPGHRLLGRLGGGAFGDVWEAQLRDDARVALKFLDCRNQPRILVANEIRILLKLRELRHPNIIRLLDVCATQQYIVLKMEKADGNLRELQEVYLQETGHAIPPDHLLELLDQAAQGLDFLAEQPRPGLSANSHGMQHCDVKPSNLLIHDDGLKIADFGLCVSSLSPTHGKRFMGTKPYAAPELFEGRVTTHTDQFALAVTYCELVTTGRVLQAQDPNSDVWTPPVDLKKLRTNEYPVLARALDPNWMARFPNCKSFVAALRDAVQKPRQSKRKFTSRQLIALRRVK